MDAASAKKEIEELLQQVNTQFTDVNEENIGAFVDKVESLHKATVMLEYAFSAVSEQTAQEEKVSEPVTTSEPEAASEPHAEQVVEAPTPTVETVQPEKQDSVPDIVLSINDKFLFTQELFNGDASAYENAVAEINSKITLEESSQLLENLQQKFNWSDESEAIKTLQLKIKNRFT